uniref:Uncharacterized protein n=1 Tax=viral metagenome TaxID=1070528 RepID=A0A6C0EZ93_9ZZZZ
MKTSDLLNSIFIIAVFIGLYIANILAIGKKNIEKNWPIYRCSPLVMPFANMFGHDVMKNFTYCIQTMQTDFMGPLLAPSNYSNLLVSNSIAQTTKTNDNSMGMFSYLRDTVLNNLTTLYNVFGNMGITLQIMVHKLKDTMNKMTGVYKATFSTMQASAIAAQSTWDALPGQLLRALPHS